MTITPQPIQGKRLAWNSFLNLITGCVILCIKLAFVPLMIRSFGTELYGVLSVTWMVLANFNWLDFGLSRATARYVAQDLALGQNDRAASWVWTAVLTQILMGAVGAIIIWYFAPSIVDLFRVQQDRKELVTLTIGLFAFSIPLEFASRSLSGVLEAGQRFDYINGLNLFNTMGTFAVYGVGIWRGADFLVIVYGLLTLRFINLLGYFGTAFCVLPSLKCFRSMRNIQRDYWARASKMIRFGSWIAMASVIGPLLLYFDQWIISIIIGVAFLPFYTVPFNLLTNLGIFPNSLSSTLFPAFSAMEARIERGKMEDYFLRAHRYLLTALIPVLFVIFTWSSELLRLWINPEFASQASLALRILSLGFGIGLLAPLSGALLQAVGRPDLLVKLYIIELPLNVAIVWILTKNFGITGAAFSFAVRTLVETILLWIVIFRVAPISWRKFLSCMIRPGLGVVLIGAAANLIQGAHIESFVAILSTIGILLAYALWVSVGILDSRDWHFIASFYRRYRLREIS